MFHKMAQMIQTHTERMLLDEVFATYRDVQDAAAEMAQVLPCPRCGKQTMKMRLHSNWDHSHFPKSSTSSTEVWADACELRVKGK